MRKFLLILPMLVLSACVSQPSTGNLQPSQTAQQLLNSNFSVKLAASYEALAALRTSAAQALSAGTLSVQDAQNIQTMADEAHSMLDAARTLSVTQPANAQIQLQQVADMLAGISKLMGNNK